MTRSLLLLTLALYTSTVFGSVYEIKIEIIDMVTPRISLDLSEALRAKFSQMGTPENAKILAIELEYKTEKKTSAIIKLNGYRMKSALNEDPYGAYVYRYQQNVFTPAYSRTKLLAKSKSSLLIGSTRHEFYLNSVIVTISDDPKNDILLRSCSYQLEAVFGSNEPISIRRFAYAQTAEIAEANACFKAMKACIKRRYSDRLETCHKTQ